MGLGFKVKGLGFMGLGFRVEGGVPGHSGTPLPALA